MREREHILSNKHAPKNVKYSNFHAFTTVDKNFMQLNIEKIISYLN